MDEDVQVITHRGESLPKSRPADGDGVLLFAEPAQVENASSLMTFLKVSESALLYLGKVAGERFGWKQLSASLRSIPKVDDRVVVFIQTSDDDMRIKREKLGDAVIIEVELKVDDFTVKDGFMNVPAEFDEVRSIYVRRSYKKAFQLIYDNHYKFTHLCGNPGIGKSCCLWYFVGLLRHKKCPLVVQKVVRWESYFYHFESGGRCFEIQASEVKRVLAKPGTWLLVDQDFTGLRGRYKTVLFASPDEANGAAAAIKTMDEKLFKELNIDAWRPSELLTLWNHVYKDNLTRIGYKDTGEGDRDFMGLKGWTSAANFMARLYICGGIVRHFFMDLVKLTELAKGAVNTYLATGKEQEASSSVNTSDKPHKVFYYHPRHDMQQIAEVTFVSTWVRKFYSSQIHQQGIQRSGKYLDRVKVDPKFAGAAGSIFEDNAHFLLSSGGNFVLGGGGELCLTERKILHYNGNRFVFKESMKDNYILPLSSSFPIIDSMHGFEYMFQISIAKKRKPMEEQDFNNLFEQCKALNDGKDPQFVLVTTKGSKDIRLRRTRVDNEGHPVPTKKQKAVSYRTVPLPIGYQVVILADTNNIKVPKSMLELEEIMGRMQSNVSVGAELFPEDGEEACPECGNVDPSNSGDGRTIQWILCEDCSSWYHFDCVKPTQEEVEGSFSCHVCRLTKL